MALAPERAGSLQVPLEMKKKAQRPGIQRPKTEWGRVRPRELQRLVPGHQPTGGKFIVRF